MGGDIQRVFLGFLPHTYEFVLHQILQTERRKYRNICNRVLYVVARLLTVFVAVLNIKFQWLGVFGKYPVRMTTVAHIDDVLYSVGVARKRSLG